MFTSNKIAQATRLALIYGAVTLPSLTVIGAVAEEIITNGQERIQITGSHIARSDFLSSSPIAIFEAEDLVHSGVSSVDEFLKQIPAFSGMQLGSSINNGNDGQKKVDMRGLGFNRTLVLINGRRMIGDVNDDGAVDLNAIPMAMVKRIEVLKDGASTVYGSDAIAGVVNIILKNKLNGLELSGSYGAGVEGWSAENKAIAVVAGASSEKSSFVMSLEHSSQTEMKQGERDWADQVLYPFLQEDGTYKAEASGSSYSRLIENISDVEGNELLAGAWITDANGMAREFTSDDLYNYAPISALVTPNERFQISFNGHYEVNAKTSVYMEGLYTQRTSHQRLAPDASFWMGLDEQIIPASNPYNPFGDNPRNAQGISGANVVLNRRFEESGGRLFSQSADTFRMVFGAEGEVKSGLYWDASYSYSANEVLNETTNYHRIDKWQTLVNPEQCSLDPACVAAGGLTFNPFADYGSITHEQLNYLMASALKDIYRGTMTTLAFSLTGDDLGVRLPGGAIGWAMGFEQRNEAGEFIPDEFTKEGLTTGGASDPQSGSFRVNEWYAEAYLPLLDTLTAEISTRYSDYNTSVGSDFNYKAGLDWQVSEPLRLRAVYATGLRAPNISELNQKEIISYPRVEPLCERSDIRQDINDTIRQNCLNLGAEIGEYGYAWQSAYTTGAPEQDLKPEQSNSLTIGGVLAVPGMHHLLVSLDYWRIRIDDFIGYIPYNDLFRACLGSDNLTSPSCAGFGETGPIDAGYPADAASDFGNLGRLSTDGIDLDVDYVHDVSWGPIHALKASFSGTYTLSREEIWPTLTSRDVVGRAFPDEVYPDLRVNTSVSFQAKDWRLNWSTQYISSTMDALRDAAITDDAVAEAIWYHDVTGHYQYDNLSLVVGLNNLFDQDPPRYHSAFNANTAPGTYDVIGRRLFINANLTF